MDFQHTLQESEILSATRLFEFPLQVSKQYFESSLQSTFTSSVEQLKKRQEILFALQKHPEFIKKANHTFRELEPYEKTVLDYKPNDT